MKIYNDNALNTVRERDYTTVVATVGLLAALIVIIGTVAPLQNVVLSALQNLVR